MIQVYLKEEYIIGRPDSVYYFAIRIGLKKMPVNYRQLIKRIRILKVLNKWMIHKLKKILSTTISLSLVVAIVLPVRAREFLVVPGEQKFLNSGLMAKRMIIIVQSFQKPDN